MLEGDSTRPSCGEGCSRRSWTVYRMRQRLCDPYKSAQSPRRKRKDAAYAECHKKRRNQPRSRLRANLASKSSSGAPPSRSRRSSLSVESCEKEQGQSSNLRKGRSRKNHSLARFAQLRLACPSVAPSPWTHSAKRRALQTQEAIRSAQRNELETEVRSTHKVDLRSAERAEAANTGTSRRLARSRESDIPLR